MAAHVSGKRKSSHARVAHAPACNLAGHAMHRPIASALTLVPHVKQQLGPHSCTRLRQRTQAAHCGRRAAAVHAHHLQGAQHKRRASTVSHHKD